MIGREGSISPNGTETETARGVDRMFEVFEHRVRSNFTRSPKQEVLAQALIPSQEVVERSDVELSHSKNYPVIKRTELQGIKKRMKKY